MRISSTSVFKSILASAALTVGACDGASSDGPKEPGVAVIEGRLDHDSGNQSVTPGIQGSASGNASLQADVRVVELNTLDANGNLTAIATAQVATDGSFRFDDVTLPGEPLIVTGKTSAEASAQVMAVLPASDADRRVSPPLSQETTVEASAFLALVADGRAPGSIDAVSLMTWISADLAASASAQSEAIVDAWVEAQAAWVAATNAATVEVAAQARLEAYAELSVALNAAADGAAEARAWATFMSDSAAAVASETSVSASAVADAEAAAAMVFAHEIGARVDANAEAHADGVGALISGHAAMTAQAASQGSASGSAAVTARLRAAYDGYYAAIHSASSAEALASATGTLAISLTGHGAGQRDGSVLGLVMDNSAGGAVAVSTQVEAAFVASATAAAAFDVSAEAALAAHSGAQLGAAMAAFRETTTGAVSASLGANAAVGAYVNEVAVQLGGQARVQFGLEDVLTSVTALGVTVSGSLIADLGLQSGADGLVAGLDGAVVADAATAGVARVGATGEFAMAATGTVNALGQIEVRDVPEIDGPAALVVLDAEGEVVASALIIGGVAEGEDLVAPPLSQESTVETAVVAEMMAQGDAYADIDVAQVFASVDAAVAAAAQSEGEVSAVAEGLMVSQRVRAEALATTGADLHTAGMEAAMALQADLAANAAASEQAHADFAASLIADVAAATSSNAQAVARAEAEANLAFRATVEALASNAGSTSAAVDARARLANAAALDASVRAMLAGNAEVAAARSTELHAAVNAYVTATAAATDRAELDAAGANFEASMLGFASLSEGATGLLGLILTADIAAQIAAQTAIQAGVEGALEAAATWSATAHAGATAAATGDHVDADAAASAMATASASFDAALTTSLTFDATMGLTADERSLVAAIAAEVAAGLYAE